MKKILKKNQIIIYVIAIMLMTAGYLNYTTNQSKSSVETSIEMEAKDDSKLADIGDAKLVNSNDILEQDTNNTTNTTNNTTNNTQSENTTNQTEQENNVNDTVQTSTNNEVKSEDDYFIKSKLERDTMYSQMIETYEKVLNSSNSLETQKQSATEEITKINQTKNGIMICENLLQTKGFKNCVIFVNKESISVIVGAEEIKQEEVAQIQNIIARELNSKIENIHISTK